jgi:AcrR family transcriptional regulator
VNGDMRDERRARIVEAAREAFAGSGLDGASMAGIAASAGMAAGTLYNYYPSKEALLVAVFEREIAGIAAGMEPPRRVGTWARAALAGYARFPRERWREFMASFYRGSPEDGLRSYLAQAPLIDSLDAVIAAQLGPGAMRDERLRRILFSTFYQGFLRWLNSGREPGEIAEEVAGDLEATVEAWRKAKAL